MKNTGKPSGYDILGNIAIVKFPREAKFKEKKKFAEKFLKEHQNVKTALEKSEKIKGRLRTPTTRWITGEKTKEALYRENGCAFRLNVDTCYFSPRLSNERKEVALQVRKNEKVLVMFGGVAPFASVIGKMSRARRVVSIELGKECCKYAVENVKRNKLQDRVEIVQGDVRKKVPLLGKFDRIIMARPNLKDSFLGAAFPAVKKNGIIYYYGFYAESEKNKMIEMIKREAKKARRKIKILKVKRAGEIGFRKFRWRVDIKVS